MQLPSKGWLISLAIAVGLIPLAFLAGRGCSSLTSKTVKASATAATTAIADSSITSPITELYAGDSGHSPQATAAHPSTLSDPSAFLFSLHPKQRNADTGRSLLSDTNASITQHNTSEPQRIDTFTVCGGARLPSGDSVRACFRAPQMDFTFDFIAGVSHKPTASDNPGGASSTTPLPGLPPDPPMEVHGYVPVEVNTSQVLMAGFGIETVLRHVRIDSLGHITTAPWVRVAGESLAFPKPPFGLVKLRVDYYW